MPNPQEFADKFAANQQANLIKAGKAVVETTIGHTAITLLRQGIEPTSENLKAYFLKQLEADPQQNHMTLPALDLLEEIASAQDTPSKQ